MLFSGHTLCSWAVEEGGSRGLTAHFLYMWGHTFKCLGCKPTTSPPDSQALFARLTAVCKTCLWSLHKFPSCCKHRAGTKSRRGREVWRARLQRLCWLVLCPGLPLLTRGRLTLNSFIEADLNVNPVARLGDPAQHSGHFQDCSKRYSKSELSVMIVI